MAMAPRRAQIPQTGAGAAASPDRSGLVVEGLRKSYKRRPVVRDVSVSVRRGEAVGLLGPNGAGKTTVFYMITGLIAADSGRISLDGADITHLPMYRRARLGIGYLAQESSIFRGLTVEENIRAVLEVRQLTSRGIGVLVTDHNVRETLELIDTALIIHEGQVLTQGTPQEIVANADVRRYYLGADFTL